MGGNGTGRLPAAGRSGRMGAKVPSTRLARTKLGIAVMGAPFTKVPLMTVTPPKKSSRHSVVNGVSGLRA